MISLAGVVVAVFFLPSILPAQVSYTGVSGEVSISGTSSLRDWEMKSTEGTTNAWITTDAAGRPSGVKQLNFTLQASSLSSGNDGMDANAGKTLYTSKFPWIRFSAEGGSMVAEAGNSFRVKCPGIMYIAGRALNTEVEALCVLNPADGSLQCAGTKGMKMTEYGLKPPVFMMGAFTTGDSVTVVFRTILKRR